MALIDRIEADFRHAEDVGGTLAIGSGVYAAGSEVIRTLEEFSLRYPKVQYEIYTNSADTLRERLDAGLLDFALLQEPIDVAHYDYFRLPTKESWGVLTRAGSELAKKKKIRANSDLSALHLAITSLLRQNTLPDILKRKAIRSSEWCEMIRITDTKSSCWRLIPMGR